MSIRFLCALSFILPLQHNDHNDPNDFNLDEQGSPRPSELTLADDSAEEGLTGNIGRVLR